MDEDVDDNLVRPRNGQEQELGRLLPSVFERKILADAARNEAPIDTEMVYGHLPAGGAGDFLRALATHQRYEFSLITEYREANEVDRTGTLVSGPLFTSAEHSWPSGPCGLLEPLFQIDLEFASNVAGRDIGSGLLQIWMDDRSALVRQIPNSAVSQSMLAPLPVEGWASFEPGYNIYSWAAAETGKPKWIEGGHQAIGVGPARFAPHQLIRMCLEDGLIDESEHYDAALVADTRRCLALIECAESSNATRGATSTNGSLFGNYHPWNFDAGIENVLLNYQPDDVLRFGGGDQAGIVFYDLDNSEIPFSFDLED